MDIKLSKRMQAVADMVMEKRVVDIGCDHAFVSIYLASQPFVERVIAMDVKTGPVDIARANIADYNLSERIEVRMSDGFKKLMVGEADVAIIAGMGGYLMIDILKGGIEHIKQGIKLVLQPQSDIKAVREYLTSVGYMVDMEDMLIDEGKYYTVMKAIPAREGYIYYNQDELKFGPGLLAAKHPVLKEYLLFSREKISDLVQRLGITKSEKSQERISQLEADIEYIDHVLQKYY